MTIDTVTSYSGTVPNKDTQTRNVFQAACDSTVAYILDDLVPGINTTVGQMNTTTNGINESELNVTALESAAAESRDFASEWATSGIGVEVDDGVNPPGESAYSWAQKTMQGERFTATSTTSHSISTGSKTFSLNESYRSFKAGSAVTIAASSAPGTNYMSGVVLSYSANSLTVNVSDVAGSGTFTSWSISMRASGSANTVGGRTAAYLLDPRNHSDGGATTGQVMVLSEAGAWAPGNTFEYETRTSNTILGINDLNKLVEITSGTFTQTFDSASTIGASWSATIHNSGAGDITLDPYGSETIDGISSFVMYPGEARRIWSDGTNLHSMVIKSFYKQFTASGTFRKPPGYSAFSGWIQSGGAGGSRYATASNAAGGGGGGTIPFVITASVLSSSETVVIGAGGSGRTTDGAGNSGGASSFAGLMVSGGSNNGANSSGGSENTIPAIAGPDGFVGAANSSGTDGLDSVYGGAGCYVGATSNKSGSSIFGGAAGGAYSAAYGVRPKGVSKLSGDGGDAGSGATNGQNGEVPGGGGGAYSGGSGSSGSGARGQMNIWGVI